MTAAALISFSLFLLLGLGLIALFLSGSRNIPPDHEDQEKEEPHNSEK